MWSKTIAFCLALAVVLQGFTLAAQRVGPRGHFHLPPLPVHTFADARGADHAHGDPRDADHYHDTIGYHEHADHDDDVVYIADDSDSQETATHGGLTRLTLDQEQLVVIAVTAPASRQAAAPLEAAAPAFHSHIAPPHDPPPRVSLV